MPSLLSTSVRVVLCAALSGQIIIGGLPRAGGPAIATARADDPPDTPPPTPQPLGAAPTDDAKRADAIGLDYGVDPSTGALTTAIPIVTPPGRLGIEPHLRLVYDSGATAPGLAGLGWALSLPVVRAEPAAGTVDPPAFVLDGERLIDRGGGEYATERDRHARIHRQCATDACGFVVDDPGGLRLRFGGVADARIDGSAWSLDRIEDAHGNYLLVSYYSDAELSARFGAGHGRDGQLVPKAIHYTGSTARLPWYHVGFDYELRPPGDDGWFQTASNRASERRGYRLTTIAITGDDDEVIRTYTLSYAAAPSGRSLLAAVAVTGLGGEVGPRPFAMTYVASASGQLAGTYQPAPRRDDRVVTGDFDGDGRADLVRYQPTDAGGAPVDTWDLQRGGSDGLAPPVRWLDGYRYRPWFFCGDDDDASHDRLFAGDWDGDGRTDLFHFAAGCGDAPPRWRVLVSRGDRFEAVDWLPAALTAAGGPRDLTGGRAVFGDFTGDRRADVLVIRPGSAELVESQPGAPGYAIDATIGVPMPPARVLVGAGDVNGDHRLDVLFAGDGELLTRCPIGPGWALASCRDPLAIADTDRLVTGDWNGDGLTDLMYGDDDAATVALSGPGAYHRQVAMGLPTGAVAGDVDGDGRDDLLATTVTFPGWVNRAAWLWRGYGFVPGASAGFPDAPIAASGCVSIRDLLPVDVTGDGRVDPIVHLLGQGCSQLISARAADAPAVDRLRSLETPTGLTVEVDYQRSAAADNPGLPIALPVVSGLVLRDFPRDLHGRTVRPVIETHHHHFRAGRWAADERRFAGFGQVDHWIDERDLIETTYFHTDAARRGRPEHVIRRRTSDGAWLSADQFRYQLDHDGPPYASELAWHVRQYWDGGALTASALQGYQYDGAGNLSRVDDHGLCAITDDDRHTETTWATGADFNLRRPLEVARYAGAAPPPADLAALTGCTGGAAPALVERTRDEYDHGGPLTRGDRTRRWRQLDPGASAATWIRTESHDYRADGLPLSTTDARGNLTAILAYDGVVEQYPERVRDPLGHDEVRTYEVHFGLLASVTDANGGTTRLDYDGFGRPHSLRTPSAESLAWPTARWAYGDQLPTWTATVTPSTDGAGGLVAAARVEFRDGLGRPLASVRDGDDLTEHVIGGGADYWAATSQPVTARPPREAGHASCGPIVSCLAAWATTAPWLIDWTVLAAPAGASTGFTYDPLGRTLRRDNPDGSFASYLHTVDGAGFGLRAIDELGDERAVFRDARGDVARVERVDAQAPGAPLVTTYEHDARGKLTAISNGTELHWDGLGRLDVARTVDAGKLFFAYDDDGHEIARTDGRGRTTTTAVDALGRPLTRTTADGVTRWYYDLEALCTSTGCTTPPAGDHTLGRPWAVVDGAGTSTYAYDRDGHLARETRSFGEMALTTQYLTWTTGAVIGKVYPDGEAHRIALAPDGQPRALFAGAGPTPLVELTRDAVGRPSEIRYGSGATTRYLVDPVSLRVGAVETTEADGTLAQRLKYHDRPDGQVESIVREEALGGAEELYLAHDGFDRLTDVFVWPAVTKPAEHYEYDADGRMTVRMDRNGPEEDVRHDDGGHPDAVTSIGDRSFGHDDSGNRIAAADRSVPTHQLTYDDRGQLVRAQVASGQVDYQYDADGHRSVETLPAGVRYLTGGYALEPDGSKRKQLVLGGLRLGERSSTGGDRFFHLDRGGSVVGESDAGGRLDVSRRYSGFGTLVAQDGHGPAGRYGFAGLPLDAETGFYATPARPYDPSTASFVQPDSWLYGFDNPEALAAYAYAANSPYQYVDPSGHEIVTLIVMGLLIAGVGIAADYAEQGEDLDWTQSILGNLAIGLIGAGTFGLVSYGLAMLPAAPIGGLGATIPGDMLAMLIATGASGAATSGAQQVYYNATHADQGSVGAAITTGLVLGLVTGALFGGGMTGGDRLQVRAAGLFVGLLFGVGGRIAAYEQAHPDQRARVRLDAPGAALPPPMCGRSDGWRTLPQPCEAAAQ